MTFGAMWEHIPGPGRAALGTYMLLDIAEQTPLQLGLGVPSRKGVLDSHQAC